MRIAFIIYDGMTSLDFIGVYDVITRLKTLGIIPDLEWEICARSFQVSDHAGLQVTPTKIDESLTDYDLIFIPGGPGIDDLVNDTEFIDWIKTASPAAGKAAISTGSIVLGAAGFLKDKRATTHPGSYAQLEPYCAVVENERVVIDDMIFTAGSVGASLDLGLSIVSQIAGSKAENEIRRQIDYEPLQARSTHPDAISTSDKDSTAYKQINPRIASVVRSTKETEINIHLNLDGSGKYEIDTGIGFLDHMLTHLAFHGHFDLTVNARGDLQVDPHHTIEDIALTLGQAFRQALGERHGIRRMASAHVPMDDTLALVAIDFSGRPYTVFEADWIASSVGGIPSTLFEHFFLSFANSAGCNLHAKIFYSHDDHHQAEALFKALARVLYIATRVDSIREDQVPSTKGTLVL